MEQRISTKRNTEKHPVTTTQRVGQAEDGLIRIRRKAKEGPAVRFNNLLTHITQERLHSAYFAIKRNAASGVDGETWRGYGEKHLGAKLENLTTRIHTGRYKPQSSKRIWIPKANGQERPIGIAALEDKIVQQVLVWIIQSIYEEDFLGFSYGFRPGRSQHNALDALYIATTQRKVSWVLDADIKGFFDNISHDWMVRFLEHRISDKRMLEIIKRTLKAGVDEDGRMTKTEVGTPQGAVISPLLANIYLHYVLDLWADKWRKKVGCGEVYIVRYADDFVVGFQYETDGRRFHYELKERMQNFGLKLHEEKTRLLEFGRFAASNRQKRKEGKPETFDFLGFTHICAKRRKDSKFTVKRITIAKKLKASIKRVKERLMKDRHVDIYDLGRWLKQVVQGYFNYYAVPGNNKALESFRAQICRAWIRALRRRSHKATKLTWEKMQKMFRLWIPSVKILHPYPNQRFGRLTQGRSRMR